MGLTALRSLIVAGCLCVFASPAWAWREASGPSANVRPFFSAGYSLPLWYESMQRGAGVGFGVELERSPGVSLIARIDLDRLQGERLLYYNPELINDPPVTITRRFSVIHWSAGARGYLRPHGSLRPYGELDFAVRYAAATGPEGLALTPRLGLAWAGHSEAGVAIDLGYEFSPADAKRYTIVPIRVAVIFP